MRSTKRVLQGLAFVTVIVVLLGLAVAQYAGVFSSGVPVTLNVARVGTQMQERSDVKINGLIVGQVDKVVSDGTATSIDMSMDPQYLDEIPENVTAQLLPKTLFGEKFVSLVPPAAPSTTRLAAGDVIPEDRSQAALEVERVLDDLLPLLQTVRPQDLATTLARCPRRCRAAATSSARPSPSSTRWSRASTRPCPTCRRTSASWRRSPTT